MYINVYTVYIIIYTCVRIIVIYTCVRISIYVYGYVYVSCIIYNYNILRFPNMEVAQFIQVNFSMATW